MIWRALGLIARDPVVRSAFANMIIGIAVLATILFMMVVAVIVIFRDGIDSGVLASSSLALLSVALYRALKGLLRR